MRGFAVKFYTKEGNWDLVGNNIPVFFIQDAIKFPDLVHSVKMESDKGYPQAGSAHDTFWDFVSLMPETSHMIMWAMSDRAIPRSLRMIEGFGIHTFRLVNAKGKSTFVKFHWKPKLGLQSTLWDEALKLQAADNDFHRRDLREAIDRGDFPEWELGLQLFDQKTADALPYDVLDSTKLIPEEVVPVRIVGRMVLDRNPDNFFAETEQVAFHIGHIVPGIDFTNDPLLQGRLFSYTDTQLIRLGGPNFHEIPINRPIAPLHNNQRDGFMRQQINKGKSAHSPNGMRGGCPFQAGLMQGGFTSYAEKIDAAKVRDRSASFFDHFSQAKLFYNSQTEPEKEHIKQALSFELGKVESTSVRERMLYLLVQIDDGLAAEVAYNIGLHIPKALKTPLNQTVPADADPEKYRSVVKEGSLDKSPALSMVLASPNDSIATRKIAILAADGVNEESINTVKNALQKQGALAEVIGPKLGFIVAENDKSIEVAKSLLTSASVFYDAVYVPGGTNSVAALEAAPDAVHFLNEAFKHCKAIAADADALQVLKATYFGRKLPADNSDETILAEGIIISDDTTQLAAQFIKAIAQHRFWEREKPRKVPA